MEVGPGPIASDEKLCCPIPVLAHPFDDLLLEQAFRGNEYGPNQYYRILVSRLPATISQMVSM